MPYGFDLSGSDYNVSLNEHANPLETYRTEPGQFSLRTSRFESGRKILQLFFFRRLLQALGEENGSDAWDLGMSSDLVAG